MNRMKRGLTSLLIERQTHRGWGSQIGRTEGKSSGYLVWQTVFNKYGRTNMDHSHMPFLKCDGHVLPSGGKVSPLESGWINGNCFDKLNEVQVIPYGIQGKATTTVAAGSLSISFYLFLSLFSLPFSLSLLFPYSLCLCLCLCQLGPWEP